MRQVVVKRGVLKLRFYCTPLRIVFDPACKYPGISRNSFLYNGLCLTENLLGVLLHLREEQVRFAGNISKMFLQIWLPERGSHIHHFLWHNMITMEEPTTYALSQVSFRDKPSSDMASFVMLKIAEAQSIQNH